MNNRMQVASRANVPPFHVMDLLAAAARRQPSHGDLVNFVAGPALDRCTPRRARGGQAAARRGHARLHRRDRRPRAARGDRRRTTVGRTGSTSTLDDVVVTTGSSGGFLLAFLAAFEPGDRVVMARPGYACYRNVLTALGLRGRRDRLRPGDAVPADRRAARGGPRARSRASSSPRPPTRPARWCRPTSSPRSRRWCEEHGVRLVSDEIYHGITYGDAERHARAPGRPRAPASSSARSASTSR